MITTLRWRRVDKSPENAVGAELQRAIYKKCIPHAEAPQTLLVPRMLLCNYEMKAFLEGIVAATEVGEACGDPQICLDAMKLLRLMKEAEVELYVTVP